MRALILGGTGFISAALARRLWADGHDVSITTRGTSRDDLPADVERIRADRFHTPQLAQVLTGRRFDVVFDLLAFDGAAVRQAYELLGRGMSRYVLMSSAQVYRPPVEDPVRETDPLAPPDAYGRGKLEAEQAAAELARTTGIPAFVIRGNITYGPRDTFGRRIFHLAQRVWQGKPILVPGRADIRANFTYVEDMGRLLALAGTAQVAGDVHTYNAGGAEVHTLAQLIDTMGRVLGRKVPIRELGLSIPEFDSHPDRAAVEWHLNAWWPTVFDTSRAKRDLGWEPRIGLEEGIARTCTWLRLCAPHELDAPIADSPAFSALVKSARYVDVPPSGSAAIHGEADPVFGDELQDGADYSPVGPAHEAAAQLAAADIAVLGVLYGAPEPVSQDEWLHEAQKRLVSAGLASSVTASQVVGAVLERALQECLVIETPGESPNWSLTAVGLVALLEVVGTVPDAVDGVPLQEILARAPLLVRCTYLRWLARERPRSELVDPAHLGLQVGHTAAVEDTLPLGTLDLFSSFAELADFFQRTGDAQAVLTHWTGTLRRTRLHLLAERARLVNEGRQLAESGLLHEQVHPVITANSAERPAAVLWAKKPELIRRTQVDTALAAIDGALCSLTMVGRLVREAQGDDTVYGVVPVPAKAQLTRPPREGDLAPDFTAPATSGFVKLSSFLGQWVVLYFYPMDDTSGCTAQGCQFRDDHQRYAGAGAVVLGVSVDPIESHGRFRAKYGLPFHLVSDADRAISRQYGVLDTQHGWAQRVTFLINPEGRIAQVFDVVDITGQSEKVLEALAQVGVRAA